MLLLYLAQEVVPRITDSHSQFRFLYRKLRIRCRGHYITERCQPVTIRRDKYGEFFFVPSIATSNQNTTCVFRKVSRSSYGAIAPLRNFIIFVMPELPSLWYFRIGGTPSAWQRYSYGSRYSTPSSRIRSKRSTI